MLVFSSFIFLQIVLESFPVSSSGHILLALALVSSYNNALFFDLYSLIDRSDIMFALHGPTAIIVALFYAPRWGPFMRKLPQNIMLFAKIIGYVFVANCMTAGCYFFIRSLSFSMPLWIGFLITFLLLAATRNRRSCLPVLKLHHFVALGLVQGVAVLPGISRLAAVYAVGCFMGLSSRKAFDVAWLLQFPLIVVAAFFGWGRLAYQHEVGVLLSPSAVCAMVIGSAVAFLGLYIMDFLAKTNKLWCMAWYIIIPLTLSLWCG